MAQKTSGYKEKKSPEETTLENLHYALAENMERLKNVDNLRISVYNFYAIVTAGLMAALMSKGWSDPWVFLFLGIVSLVTLLINRRIRIHVNELTKKLKETSEAMGIGKYYTDGGDPQSKLSLRNIYVYIPFTGTIVFFSFFIVKLIN